MKDMHDIISQFACEIYRKNGCMEGRDLDNWLEAEQMVMSGADIDQILHQQ